MFLVIQDKLRFARKGGGVAHRDEISGNFVLHQLAVADNVGRDGWYSQRHGLHERIGLSLVVTGKPETGCLAEDCHNVVAMSQEVDSVLNLYGVTIAFKQVSLRAIAHDQ